MKVTSMQLVPPNGADPCVLSFRDPRRLNPYNVIEIFGLDADEIVAKNYGLTSPKIISIPGQKPRRYYELSILKREPVVQIQLNPRPSLGESYSSLRDNLARMIASTRTGDIQLVFKNGDLIPATITGRVQKFESDLFSKNPTVTITFTCSDGMLRSPLTTDIVVEDLDPAEATIVDSESTAPHGMKFSILVLTACDQVSVHEPDVYVLGSITQYGSWSFDLAPVGGFLSNDLISGSSEANNKYLTLTRGFNTTHIVDTIVPGSIWPLIFPGNNRIGLNAPEDLTWVSMSHIKTYWGV